MKVVVTGATGLIGSNLVKYYLKNTDAKIVAVGHSAVKMKKVFWEYIDSPNFDFVLQDLSVPCDFERVTSQKFHVPADYIFHAAGSAEQSVINKHPSLILKPNLLGLFSILDSIKNKETRCIIFSSVTVYGNNSCASDLVVSEDDLLPALDLNNPYAAYFETKKMQEVITNAYIREKQINAIIVRPSTVYGYTTISPNSAFYSFLEKAKNNENFELNKSGLPRRDNIYIDDIVLGLLTVASKGKCGEVYNISSDGFGGNFVAIDEIAEKISSIANTKYGCNIKVSFKEEKRNNRLSGIRLNCDKLKALGWAPSFSLEKGIEETISNYFEKSK